MQHKADIGVGSAFVAWLIAHIDTINSFLQFGVLVLGGIGAIYGILRHRKQMKKGE